MGLQSVTLSERRYCEGIHREGPASGLAMEAEVDREKN